jgi:hypothetical protein
MGVNEVYQFVSLCKADDASMLSGCFLPGIVGKVPARGRTEPPAIKPDGKKTAKVDGFTLTAILS